jgi:hypothetical protein
MLTSDIRKHKETYSDTRVKHNSNKLKYEPVHNGTKTDRERFDRRVQRGNCTTHDQKLAKHPNTETHPNPTDVGIYDKETSRNEIPRETQAWGTLSVTELIGE